MKMTPIVPPMNLSMYRLPCLLMGRGADRRAPVGNGWAGRGFRRDCTGARNLQDGEALAANGSVDQVDC